jgi:predicted dehydrogenase/threonine dehydrogenase-like Zn-dependent dehydrogenase
LKQVIAVAGKVQVSEVPTPVCDDNGILVQTSFSVISTGTETWTIDSTEPLSASNLVRDSSKLSKAFDLSRKVLREEGVSGFADYYNAVRHPEFPIGYSSAGTVLEVGRNVSDICVGDRVACAGEGKACHAEIVSVPRNLVAKVPNGVDSREAAFSTIGSIALHAFRQSRAQLGEYVAVIGAGLVGNLVSQIARASGCYVVTLDLKEDRLALARELGVDLALRSDDPNLLQHLSHFTNGKGFDTVLVCAATASSEPINMASKILRNRGRLVVVGRVGMELERKEFYQKELELIMSRSLGPGRYDLVYEEKGVDYPREYIRWTLNRNMESFLGLLESKRVNVAGLVGAEFEMQKAPEAYAFLETQPKVAVVLTYPQQVALEKNPGVASAQIDTRVASSPAISFKPLKGKIGTALVGPGNFAKETLIPVLRKNPNFDLRWVVSSNPIHAKQIASRYHFAKSTCDLEDALKDPEVSLVVVAAPNNLHYSMLLQAIKAGKVAFVEKPLCLTRSELDEIKKAQRESGGLPIFVGFNRRYAPLVLEIKKAMKKLDGPFFITYRANVGFIPTSRWVQDPTIGGGRIIAECCHFFDLFNFLLEQSKPTSIQVSSSDVNGSSTVAVDNVAVTLKYPDGSVANLVYVALGNKDMDRERMEVFGQGTSFVLDDFKKLTTFGSSLTNEVLPRQDKGWVAEFEELAEFLHGEKSTMIRFEECVDATELTLRVNDAVGMRDVR